MDSMGTKYKSNTGITSNEKLDIILSSVIYIDISSSLVIFGKALEYLVLDDKLPISTEKGSDLYKKSLTDLLVIGTRALSVVKLVEFTFKIRRIELEMFGFKHIVNVKSMIEFWCNNTFSRIEMMNNLSEEEYIKIPDSALIMFDHLMNHNPQSTIFYDDVLAGNKIVLSGRWGDLIPNYFEEVPEETKDLFFSIQDEDWDIIKELKTFLKIWADKYVANNMILCFLYCSFEDLKKCITAIKKFLELPRIYEIHYIYTQLDTNPDKLIEFILTGLNLYYRNIYMGKGLDILFSMLSKCNTTESITERELWLELNDEEDYHYSASSMDSAIDDEERERRLETMMNMPDYYDDFSDHRYGYSSED
jgi:hypothetical protein